MVIPDAGHSPQFENPPVWFAALDGFLAELPAAQAPVAFSRKRARSTMTRVMRPAATSPWPSLTDTRNVSLRPSIISRVASARTLPPTAVGARWSSCTRYPTLVVPSASVPSIARIDASSASRTTRGVASTGTSPVDSASAVSSSPTTSSAVADKPGRGGIGPTIDNPSPRRGLGRAISRIEVDT